MPTAKTLDLRTLSPDPKYIILDNGTPEGEKVNVTSLKLAVQLKAMQVQSMTDDPNVSALEQGEATVELISAILHKPVEWVADNIDDYQMGKLIEFIGDNAKKALAENDIKEEGASSAGEAPTTSPDA